MSREFHAKVGDGEFEVFATVNETCKVFSISRATFYRMLADPESGLDEIVVRIPPPRGNVRVPLERFREWLQRESRGA